MNPTYAVLVLYVKHTEACKQGMTLEAIDMIEAVCRVVNGRNGGNSGKVLGAQRLNNLWLLYLHDEMTRLDVYTKGELMLHGRRVTIYDQNPYTTYVSENEHDNEKRDRPQNDKITIKNLPLFVSNEEIKKMLEEHNIV